MSEPSLPASPAHTPSAPAHLPKLSTSTRLDPATNASASDQSDFIRDVFNTEWSSEPFYERNDTPANATHASSSVGIPASGSSSSISPIATGNRAVRRRGSSRSSSFASIDDAAVQDISSYLSPKHASPGIVASAIAGSASIMQTHRRDISADITGRGMLAHSRNNSNNSGILVYSPSTGVVEDLQARPSSTSAWSKFSLGREYGLEDTSSVETSRNEREDQFQDDDEVDNDTRFLTDSNTARTGFTQRNGRSFDVDLEGPAANVYDADNGLRRGISKRVKGTERYYRDSRNAASSAGGLNRQGSILANVQHGLRKMSIRVVNLPQHENNEHVALSADAEELFQDKVPAQERQYGSGEESVVEAPGSQQDEDRVPEKTNILRGKSLGLFGPESRIRNAALRVFLWRYELLMVSIPA